MSCLPNDASALMAARNVEAGPSRQPTGSLAMADANPLTLPALASDIPRRLLSKRKFAGSQSATSRHKGKDPEQIDPAVMDEAPPSPRTKRRRARLLGEETKRKKKQMELEQERGYLAGTDLSRELQRQNELTSGDPDGPSDNLLRSLHLHAADFYASQGLMPPEPRLKSDQEDLQNEPSKGPSTRARRVDMTNAIEGRGLVVLGMIVQEIINDALEKNGMREEDATRVALEQEKRLGLEPREMEESDMNEEEVRMAENPDSDASDDNSA